MADSPHSQLLALTAEIVSSHVSNNTVALGDLPAAIENVYAALGRVTQEKSPPEPKQEPAVSVRASIKPDHLVCLEDGKRLKMLKRHLMSQYDMTPDEYRAKWNLPADYPMVAPNYAKQRRELAMKIGLGRKQPAQPPQAAPAKSRRRLKIVTPTE